jgi:hypothetical protein
MRFGGNMILKWILKEQMCGSMGWIGMAVGRDNWRALVEVAMRSYLRVQQKTRNVIS